MSPLWHINDADCRNNDNSDLLEVLSGISDLLNDLETIYTR